MPLLYERAIAYTIKFEGGYSNDPNDPGGATNYGISLRFLRSIGLDTDGDGDIDADDIRNLTTEQVTGIYKEHFWDKYYFADIPDYIGIKAFDLTVNMGPRPAGILLQRSVRSVTGYVLRLDGAIGPLSKNAIYNCNAECLLSALCSEAAGFYRELVARQPRFSIYFNGWQYRAYSKPRGH